METTQLPQDVKADIDALEFCENFYFMHMKANAVRAALDIKVFTTLSGGRKLSLEEITKELGIQLRKPEEFF